MKYHLICIITRPPAMSTTSTDSRTLKALHLLDSLEKLGIDVNDDTINMIAEAHKRQKEIDAIDMNDHAAVSGRLIKMYDELKEFREKYMAKEIATRHSFWPPRDPAAQRVVGRMMTLEANHWIAHELDYINDRASFNKDLCQQEREVIINIIGFLHFADGVFADDVMIMFQAVETNIYNQRYYVAQADQERIHADAYELQLNALLPNPKDREALRHRVQRCGSLKEMHAFMDGISKARHIGEVRVKVAATEFLMFTPLFAIIFWFRHFRGHCIRDIIATNNFIIRDEADHCRTTVGIYNDAIPELKLPAAEIYTIVDTVKNLVVAFMNEYFGHIKLEGFNIKDVNNYVHVIANELLVMFQLEPVYDCYESLHYMNTISMAPKTNHFEGRTTEYSKGSDIEKSLQAYITDENNAINGIDDDTAESSDDDF